tara:strand:- start:243 stop:1349 length:1107 start_codon:yes stop_codon:yes gene_type:complete
MSVVEQSSYAKWYKNREYVPFMYSVKYMAPVGMPRKYGFWAIPELYAKVLIGLPDNSNPNEWIYLGSIYDKPSHWDGDVPYYSTLQEKSLKGTLSPLPQAYATNVQSQVYGLMTPQGNSLVISDNTGTTETGVDNKGVFLSTSDGKAINMHGTGRNATNDSIVIQSSKETDSITLTGPKSKKPIGPRGFKSTTQGNSITQSRGGTLEIQVGTGGSDAKQSGRQLSIKNVSLAYGKGAKTQFTADNIEDLKSEGCGSIIIEAFNNDIEITATKERIMIVSQGNCQITSNGETKIISNHDITLQSNLGNINLKALAGKVNIESKDSINIQSNSTIDLNKVTPASYSITPVEPDLLNKKELKEKLSKGEIT